MEDYRKIEPTHKKDPYDADRDDPHRYLSDMTIDNSNKPVKYRRPWSDSIKDAAVNLGYGLMVIAIFCLVIGAIAGAVTLIVEVSWLFIFPIVVTIFILMVLANRFGT